MSRWTPEDLASIVGGRWTMLPTEWHVCGVGTDTRRDLTDQLFVALRGESHDGHAFVDAGRQAGAAAALVERDDPAVCIPQLVVDDTRRALGALASAWRQTLDQSTVVAITGSSGKTSTKSMLAHVLAAAGPVHAAPKSFNNEVGVPLTLLGAEHQHRAVIVEVGTNAPGEIAALAAVTSPDVGVITNAGRAHLGGFDSEAAIVVEKSSLLCSLRRPGLAVICADGPELGSQRPHGTSAVRFGCDPSADVQLTNRGRNADGRSWFQLGDGSRFDLALPGRAMAMNALAVVAVARHFGLDDGTISARLATVQPAPMRFEERRIGERLVIDDSYNANPDSMAAALETFIEITGSNRPRVAVLGDMRELGDASAVMHADVVSRVRSLCSSGQLDRAVLVGPHMCRAAGAASACIQCIHDAQDDAALANAAETVAPDAQVLVKASRGVRLERIIAGWEELVVAH